jgi:hypothetical protein
MNNGIMFGNQGPVMTGTWYNPNTGDSFTVRDSFFENNQYFISTTDGRMLGYDVIQNYVQSDKPLEMPKKQTNDLPDEVANLIDDTPIAVEDNDLFVDTDIYGTTPAAPVTLGNLNVPKSSPAVATNEGIISKALGKASKPEVIADIKWVDFPKKQIEMLSEIMEIDTKEIVEWYASQLNTTEIAISIHNSIVRYINDQLYGTPVDLTLDISDEQEQYLSFRDEPMRVEETISVVVEDKPKPEKKAKSAAKKPATKTQVKKTKK